MLNCHSFIRCKLAHHREAVRQSYSLPFKLLNSFHMRRIANKIIDRFAHVIFTPPIFLMILLIEGGRNLIFNFFDKYHRKVNSVSAVKYVQINLSA